MAAAAGSAGPKRGKTPEGDDGGRKRPDATSKRRVISDHDRREVLKLHAERKGRNDIARITGLAPATVSKIISAGGKTFDRSATAAATEARMTDLKARRAQLSELLLEDAFKLRDHAWVMREKRIEDADGVLQKVELEERDGREMKDLYLATAIAVDKHLAIVKVDSDDRDLPAVDAWLAGMMGGQTK